MWNEAVVAWFEAVFRHLPGGLRRASVILTGLWAGILTWDYAPRRAGFDPSLDHVGFVLNRVSVGRAFFFSSTLLVYCQYYSTNPSN